MPAYSETSFSLALHSANGTPCVTPEGAQEVVQCKPDWSEFVEACFTPGSELNRRLKQMILNMGEEEKHK